MLLQLKSVRYAWTDTVVVDEFHSLTHSLTHCSETPPLNLNLQFEYVYADITIEFETSSNIGKYEALCVVEGEDCDGAPLGDGVVVADSYKKTATKQTRQVVVTNVDVTTDDIECFVRASGPVSKKQLCVPVTPKGKPGPCTCVLSRDCPMNHAPIGLFVCLLVCLFACLLVCLSLSLLLCLSLSLSLIPHLPPAR
jgi:hypothetical protein